MNEKTTVTKAGSMLSASVYRLGEASKATQDDVLGLMRDKNRALMGVASSESSSGKFTVASVSFHSSKLGDVVVEQVRCEAKTNNYDRNDVWFHTVINPLVDAFAVGCEEVVIAMPAGWLSNSIGSYAGGKPEGEPGWALRWKNNGWLSRNQTPIVQRMTAEALLSLAEGSNAFTFVHSGPLFNRMHPLALALLEENQFARVDSVGEKLAPKPRGRNIIRIPRATTQE